MTQQTETKVARDAFFEQEVALPLSTLAGTSDERSLSDASSDRCAVEASHPRRMGFGRLAGFFSFLTVAILSLNALIGYGVRHVRTSSLGAWNEVMQGRVNADVIISGSSRATYHFDPRVIEATTGRTAFNIGKVGSQTDVELAVLRAYLEHNRKPRLIIHSLDAFSFVTTKEIYDPAQYVPYLGDKELYKPLLRLDPALAKSRYVPLYGYVVEDMNFTWFIGLRSLVGWQQKENYYRGFSPREREWTEEFERFKQMNPNGAKFDIEPDGVKALEGLVQLCKEERIPLILVYSPEYREMQSLTINRKEIFQKFSDIAGRYGVPLWDYSDWPHSSDKSRFYNSQHLNASGAEEFSAELAERLKTELAADARSYAKPSDARSTSDSVAQQELK